MNGLVVIGGSAGGTQAVKKILSGLHPEFPFPVVVVLHVKSDVNKNHLVDVLNHHTRLTVTEACMNQVLETGFVYVAPADYHLHIEVEGYFSLSADEKEHYSRPSIDILFESVSGFSVRPLIGILLSGANEDGARGLSEIEFNGGYVIVQNPDEAEIPVMPLAGIDKTLKPDIFTIEEIITFLNNKGAAFTNG